MATPRRTQHPRPPRAREPEKSLAPWRGLLTSLPLVLRRWAVLFGVMVWRMGW